MAEDLSIIKGSKEEQYQSLLPQLQAIVAGEPDLIANLANTAAALYEQFGWLWVGFYLVKPSANRSDEELVLGPFQGPVACTRIRKGKGVCGTAWQEASALRVADVELFPGHIACSSRSRSEIVIPVLRNGAVVAVLDVDSEVTDAFDATDELYLKKIIELIPWY